MCPVCDENLKNNDVKVIRKTILFCFINRMKLTTDSIIVVPIAVHKMVPFCKESDQNHHHHPPIAFFCGCEQLPHHACMQYVDARVRAQVLGSQTKAGWLIASLLFLTLRTMLLPTVMEALVFLLLYLGCTHEIQSENSAEEKVGVAHRRQSGCKAGMSQGHVFISNIVGNCQRKRL